MNTHNTLLFLKKDLKFFFPYTYYLSQNASRTRRNGRFIGKKQIQIEYSCLNVLPKEEERKQTEKRRKIENVKSGSKNKIRMIRSFKATFD